MKVFMLFPHAKDVVHAYSMNLNNILFMGAVKVSDLSITNSLGNLAKNINGFNWNANTT